jgi:hypothetical protein
MKANVLRVVVIEGATAAELEQRINEWLEAAKERRFVAFHPHGEALLVTILWSE